MSDWIKHAKAGDKVELIRDLIGYVSRALDEGVTLPERGRVYTIRDMEPGIRDRRQVFLRLEEILNGPSVTDGIEPSFFSGWFRPVIARPTSIDVFTDMLKSVPVEELV